MLLQQLAGHDAELWSCPAALPIAASLNVKDLLQRFRRHPGQRPSLIHAYVRQQIKQYVDDNWTSDHPIHSGSVLRHLSWIEQTVERRGGMAFDPDQVGPSAVDAVALRRIITIWTPVVVGGIVGGLSLLCLWPTFDLADVVFQHPPRASIAGIRPAVLIATGCGTLIGLLVAKAPPLRLSGDVQWSGPLARRRFRSRLRVGLPYSLLVGLGAGALGGLPAGASTRLAFGTSFAAAVLILYTALGGCVGEPAPALLEQATTPRELQVSRAARRAVVCGLPFALAVAALTVLLHRHLATRCLLVQQGCMPWRLVKFLEDMTTYRLLRRVGTGYDLYHPLIGVTVRELASKHSGDGDGAALPRQRPA